ncbi:MAG: hypothetical protein AAGB26_06875 [Planctomycetota bacterium]
MPDPSWWLAIPGAIQATYALIKAAHEGKQPEDQHVKEAERLLHLLEEMRDALNWVQSTEALPPFFDKTIAPLGRVCASSRRLMHEPPSQIENDGLSAIDYWFMADGALAALIGQVHDIELPMISVSGEDMRGRSWRIKVSNLQSEVNQSLIDADNNNAHLSQSHIADMDLLKRLIETMLNAIDSQRSKRYNQLVTALSSLPRP